MKHNDKFYIQVGRTSFRQYVEPYDDNQKCRIKINDAYTYRGVQEKRLSYYGAANLDHYFWPTISEWHNLETRLDKQLEAENLENHLPNPE